MPVTYEPIASTLLGSATSSITFSSIPSTYTDLRLIISAGAASDSTRPSISLRFNGVFSAFYASNRLLSDGINANHNYGTGADRIVLGAGANPLVASPFSYIIDINNYADSTIRKCALAYVTAILNDSSGGQFLMSTGRFESTNAISQIQIFDANNYNMSVGSRATLYGILRA